MERSYRFLNSYGNAEEMSELLSAFDRERAGKHVCSGKLESITADRRGRPSYLELAETNSAHFSAPAGTPGAAHNMGAYSAFHQAALRAASDGDADRARILESMGMHYLTDRHAGGHMMDKEGLMAASGYPRNSLRANLSVRWLHDFFNNRGMPSRNAAGQRWNVLGDAHWDDPRNEENRFRTAVSVLTSWSELASVANDPARLDEVAALRGAESTVPLFSPGMQSGLEGMADFPAWFLYGNNLGDLPSATRGKASIWWHRGVVHPASDTWSDFKSEAAKALDWRTWARLSGAY